MADIRIDKDTHMVNGTAAADNISADSEASNVTVNALAGNDNVDLDYTPYCFVYGGDGKDTVRVAMHSYVDGGMGDDSIDGLTEMAHSGNNSYSAEGYFTLAGGGGNDTIEAVMCLGATIDGGANDDYLVATGADLVLSGGAGNDVINCGLSAYGDRTIVATIEGGTGNDTIRLNGGHGDDVGALIKYNSGDGNDVICDLNCKVDILEVDTNFTAAYDDNDSDIVLTMGNGSKVTLSGITISKYMANPLQITGGTGRWGDELYTYTGGWKTLYNYSGEKVKWATDYAGLSFDDTYFAIHSNSGWLTLLDGVNKIIDVADARGNTIAYAFKSTYGGMLDGSGLSTFEVIVGGDNSSNDIRAGSGGSSLWGGGGVVADTLIGGAGADCFYLGEYDGSDVIYNASQDDKVMLYNVELANIGDFSTTANSVSLYLWWNGSTVTINDQGGLSPTFQLSDGSCWKFNHSTNNWQSA